MFLSRRRLLQSAAAFVAGADAAAAAETGFDRLTAEPVRLSLLPQKPTVAAGFGGQVPGPLLRIKKGAEFRLRLVNRLTEPVTFAAQGLRLANPMDGIAGLTQAAVLPEQSFDYRFTPQDAGFFWYRSGVLSAADRQLAQGLFGPLIVDEAEPPFVDQDRLVVLADWHLDPDGGIDFSRGDLAPAQGTPAGTYVVTLDGRPAPIAQEAAPGARLRLRLLSLISTQLVFVTFAGFRPFVVGIDGQPCEAFAPLRQTLPLGPGATFDLIGDLPTDAAAPAASIAWRTGERSDRPLVIFTMDGAARAALPPITSLPANPYLPQRIDLAAAAKIDLHLELAQTKPDDKPAKTGSAAAPQDRRGTLLFNGATAQAFGEKPLFSVKRGSPVTLGFANKTPLITQIHVHGHALRLLHDLDDGWEPYWRNRLIVPESHTKHVAFIADNPGKWAIEWVTLELRPRLLMGWFEVG